MGRVAWPAKKRYRWRNEFGEGIHIDIHTQAVQLPATYWPQNSAVPPLYQTAAYTYHSVDQVDRIFLGEESGYTYTRGGNPTSETLAALVRDLEGGDGAVVAASGMGALLVGIMTLAPKPTPILLAREVYGGSVGLVRQVLEPLGYSLNWVDARDEMAIRAALSKGPGLLLVETISNPLGRVSPLDTLIPAAHQAGCKVLVDNTFATPYHARPLQWGADLVMHSVTKFIGGHSDLILGVLVGSDKWVDRAASLINVMGVTPDPYASWLALRGARTLALRMERASENAMTLAAMLKNHAALVKVYYPGLTSHPDYAIARRILSRGFGAIFALHLKGGRRAVERFASGLKLVPFVPSLGDVMTTISHPAVASHRELSAEEQETVGIDDGVVRVSVGIENVRDLIEDFGSALTEAEPV
ncbi:MAG: aminotransferase class I/II-fold pyridoxal phosphate-dependent enzyme [Thermaerobacter sp.]|nr:aminotransferase class I/II-fold pyridoxal phosphate-dependent enzyme [Thermaerobacter sp.]